MQYNFNANATHRLNHIGEQVNIYMFDFGQANEEQKKVIQHTDGPTLIIAGPGTGKTFTLHRLILALINLTLINTKLTSMKKKA